MTPEIALRILGLSGKPTAKQLEDARRGLLSALNPNKHPTDGADVFERLTSDVNEAYKVLLPFEARAQLPEKTDVEETLFDVNASAQWSRAKALKGRAVTAFYRRYANDKIVAIAILGIDRAFGWSRGDTTFQGTALYVLVWNRTNRRVEGLNIGSGFLIDDRGNQYSSEGSFYWTGDNGAFQTHPTTLAPSAKWDGFLIYPALRAGATAYARWYLASTVHFGENYIKTEHDIEIPSEPQDQALLSGSLPLEDMESIDDIDLDGDDEDGEEDESDEGDEGDEDGDDEDGADEDGADEDGADEDGADEDGADEDGDDEDDEDGDDEDEDDEDGDDEDRDDDEKDVAAKVIPLAPDEWRAINRLGVDWSEYSLTRQQLAVLVLDGQPFGFTWRDAAAMIATVRAAELRSQHELADQLRPIRDKIAALLAPRTAG